jgi:hypothetical protein
LSLPPRATSREGRPARCPSRVVAAKGFGPPIGRALVGVLVPLGASDSVLLLVDAVMVDSLSLFITSARAFPTERVMVRDSRLERAGRAAAGEPDRGGMAVGREVVLAPSVFTPSFA